MTKKKVSGYVIDFTSDTVYVNYKFQAASNSFGTPEYKLMRKLLRDFPNMKVVVRSGRRTTSTNRNKRLTYENMERHIQAYNNSQELLDTFQTVKALSQVVASPYKYVCDWFIAQFPNYKNVPVFAGDTLSVLPVEPPKVEDYKVKLKGA